MEPMVNLEPETMQAVVQPKPEETEAETWSRDLTFCGC